MSLYIVYMNYTPSAHFAVRKEKLVIKSESLLTFLAFTAGGDEFHKKKNKNKNQNPTYLQLP